MERFSERFSKIENFWIGLIIGLLYSAFICILVNILY